MLLVQRLCGLLSSLAIREALLAEMGVAMREDGGTVGVFSPKKVRRSFSAVCAKRKSIWSNA